MHDEFSDAAAPEIPLEEPLPVVLRAMHCWNFCRGRPDLVPLYDAVHGLDDWDLTLALMGEITDTSNG